MNHPLLDTIDSPANLRALPREQLPQLTDELRAFMVESVSKTGGHLSSNLGTVELTVALHYVFDTPTDRLVWDVGHQTYAHKALTGRRTGMERLRMKDGVSGFPRRSESEYDTFGVGHSSTSISAALGMAVAARNKGEERRVVAIIGDGAGLVIIPDVVLDIERALAGIGQQHPCCKGIASIGQGEYARLVGVRLHQRRRRLAQLGI